MNVPDVRAGAQRGCEISFLGGIDNLTDPSKLIRVGPAGVLGKKLQAPSNLNHAMMQYCRIKSCFQCRQDLFHSSNSCTVPDKYYYTVLQVFCCGRQGGTRSTCLFLEASCM